MSRRKGQNGSRIEEHGEHYTSRIWMDVPGQEERVHVRIKISPIDRKASGWLNKAERENKLKDIIRTMGANSEQRFNEVVRASENVLITFAEQSEVYLHELTTRGDHGAAKNTIDGFARCLRNWLNPLLGELSLDKINNGELKRVVARMKQNGLSPRIEQEQRKQGRSDDEITKWRRKGSPLRASISMFLSRNSWWLPQLTRRPVSSYIRNAGTTDSSNFRRSQRRR
jgi:hypothetical protein